MTEPVLSIRGLTLGFPSTSGTEPVLRGVDLDVAPRETLGVVGESGSGKSLTALSVLGLLPPGARVLGGEVRLQGRDVLTLPADELRPYRGGTVGFVFQDATSALDPSFTVGSQLVEAIRSHQPGVSKRHAQSQAVELLEAVDIPDPAARIRQYPHQLSGGMRQRCMIAIAIANRPLLVIADEPTTALDVTLQARILALLKRMIDDIGTAMLLIGHDLGVIAETCDRVAVMYAGRVVESGPTNEVLSRPRHPYTAALQRSLPQTVRPGEALAVIAGQPPVGGDYPSGCAFHPRCEIRAGRDVCATDIPEFRKIAQHWSTACHFADEVEGHKVARRLLPPKPAKRASAAPLVVIEDLTKAFTSSRGFLRRRRQHVVRAVDGLDLTLETGETLAIVGESGSGKTTVGRLIIGLLKPDSGRILMDGEDLPSLSRRMLRQARRDIQMVFQDPYSSLNPRLTARDIVAEPLRLHGLLDAAGWKRVDSLLEEVGLSPVQFKRYPAEFSGGQRQRIGIARALALEPRLVILDEPVSALDASIQAGVLNLIARLQREHRLTYVFISHDLSVVAQISDRIAVMRQGQIVELGTREEIFGSPRHDYTKALLDAIPKLPTEAPRVRAQDHVTGPSGITAPSSSTGSP